MTTRSPTFARLDDHHVLLERAAVSTVEADRLGHVVLDLAAPSVYALTAVFRQEALALASLVGEADTSWGTSDTVAFLSALALGCQVLVARSDLAETGDFVLLAVGVVIAVLK